MTIELSKVKAELNEWRYLIGDDVVDAIILNLEEEADEDEPQTNADQHTQSVESVESVEQTEIPEYEAWQEPFETERD